MKNKFALGLFTGAAAFLLIAAAEYDLNKGIDLTGSTSVTASKLNQLVDNGTVAGNKGMIIYTNTTPDTTNNARYTRFLWMDTSYSPPVPMVYYTNGGYWTNITANTTIADNSVTAGKLAQNSVYTSNIVDNAITDTKILAAAVTSSKIASGSISSSHVAGYTLLSTNIATNGIVGFNITAASVTGDKIASGSISNSHLNANMLYGSNITANTITTTNLTTGAVTPTNLVASPAAMQLPRINAAGTGFEWVNGGLLQSFTTNFAAAVNCTTATALGASAPTTSEGDQIFIYSFTPKSASSKLKITVSGWGFKTTSAHVITTVFSDSTCIGVQATYAPTSETERIGIVTTVASGSTSARSITVRVGCSSGSIRLNSYDGTNQGFGGNSYTTLLIEELY